MAARYTLKNINYNLKLCVYKTFERIQEYTAFNYRKTQKENITNSKIRGIYTYVGLLPHVIHVFHYTRHTTDVCVFDALS